MRNLDAMGYNAVSTDPLYKHIPFTIARRDDVSYGLFYDNLSSCWLDLGNEIDNYHTAYRRWQAEAGDIDYYMFTGRRVLEVTKAFVRLTGKNAVRAEVEPGLQRFHYALHRRAGCAKSADELYSPV
jgi:alpha-glucosidase